MNKMKNPEPEDGRKPTREGKRVLSVNTIIHIDGHKVHLWTEYTNNTIYVSINDPYIHSVRFKEPIPGSSKIARRSQGTGRQGSDDVEGKEMILGKFRIVCVG